jgi:hypothetical protein
MIMEEIKELLITKTKELLESDTLLTSIDLRNVAGVYNLLKDDQGQSLASLEQLINEHIK